MMKWQRDECAELRKMSSGAAYLWITETYPDQLPYCIDHRTWQVTEQSRLLQRCFEEAGGEAVSGWLAVNRTLARAHAGSRGEAATEAAD